MCKPLKGVLLDMSIRIVAYTLSLLLIAVPCMSEETVFPHKMPEKKPDMELSSAVEQIPSTDWDLCEIWHATSEDGFTWEEQGVAVPRPPKPSPGWRSVATPDILVWKGKGLTPLNDGASTRRTAN
jgi:hypothetical protein